MSFAATITDLSTSPKTTERDSPSDKLHCTIGEEGDDEDDGDEYGNDHKHRYPPIENRHLNLIHEELEKLNIATDVINKMEVQLDTARAEFRETQGLWSEKLKELSKQYSSQIEKARPYYELKIEERKLREESQKAAERFERATSLLVVAKQQVSLTQDSLSRQSTVLPECLEVLNHHIQRVSEVEEERMLAEALHASKAHSMLQLAEKIRKMEKQYRSSIRKSRHYFEKRLEFTKILECQKGEILKLESEVRQKKHDYTTSLRNLEKISEQIHEERLSGSSEIGNIDNTVTESNAFPDFNSLPCNPPPYAPTAPPPYEDQYFIEKDADTMVLNIMKEEQEDDKRNSRSLGSGVILLAQQLMGTGGSEKHNVAELKFDVSDISYHTRPAGLSGSSDNSEVSSLSSFNITDDDTVAKMLMNHSELIKDIESATDRVGNILKPTVNNMPNAHSERTVCN